MFTSTLQTPIGLLVIEASDDAVQYIGFKDAVEEDQSDLTEIAKKQFEEYFKGKRKEFDFPFSQGGSEFQQKVWSELIKVQPGNPISYAALSRQMNSPLAIRAIASANGKNNLMIVVPCHRIIGSNGDLVGYSAGLWRKKWLLDHEAKMMGVGQAVLSL
ncbi:MAG: methylated-DNA--[protein]-cysteine S-methyltransferase [Sphingobacteriaceae bacterium]|jgi:methylated-DNA-[protein]-cysteine S-methyltransferase|nr:methylated-DNA--[protein]-cysteine S-methyltransferase [Sphingobacteriaceae bacterium]